ncbi:hypothetical protein Goklo_022545, partial [Gossypium klotzschianum]|nr:hypothetical protein [Gossypium klotzschianum]
RQRFQLQPATTAPTAQQPIAVAPPWRNVWSSTKQILVSFPDPETSLTVHLRVTDGSMNKFNTPDARCRRARPHQPYYLCIPNPNYSKKLNTVRQITKTTIKVVDAGRIILPIVDLFSYC